VKDLAREHAAWCRGRQDAVAAVLGRLASIEAELKALRVPAPAPAPPPPPATAPVAASALDWRTGEAPVGVRLLVVLADGRLAVCQCRKLHLSGRVVWFTDAGAAVQVARWAEVHP
jgi:hypothetical protein